ncbi:SDR family NAD(P)-dependent oxidoreductase [Saccharopolyspora sp. ASAGF58]|uniref:SDR family NAD(P)-dependent oxidoreductase n=1 Tax=Saccharopolyspora sp. ASAGF58 TaxID=2719023 RepID=UPI0014401656|nr:SDR family NAD(P)-dependent oxidoreductase [Saccharopolyspora sp. ASAGF58]QIZ37982.1 SDR family NAD(P)-dependent oxidoreductase [Saccharopolyspora sp. ASAGF58]
MSDAVNPGSGAPAVSLADRVAVVTGAGGGLGRSHALALSARGAAVVVNDIGRDTEGHGSDDDSPAKRVVAEIEERGGTAIAHAGTVDTTEGAESIVGAALERFGRIDVVVNNAGIIRDQTFAKLTADDFADVVRVHLIGTANVTRAAWPHMRDAQYGRVVNTAAGAGLYGNFGQSAYSAAKMGIVGLTRTLAVEGARRNIHVNVIAPMAVSRMTERIMDEELQKRFRPEYVSAMVAFLASENCAENGRIFELGGGYYSRVAVVQGEGVVFDDVPTPEQIEERLTALSDVSEPFEAAGSDDLMPRLRQRLAMS